MIASGDSTISLISSRRLVFPGIDDQSAIEPDPNTIVGRRGKSVSGGIERMAPGPTHREIVVAHTVAGTSRAPVVIDSCLTAGKCGVPAQTNIVKVLRKILSGGTTGGGVADGKRK